MVQIKEDTVEPSVPAREFYLKAYAAITWQMIRQDWALNPGHVGHCSQVACTVTNSAARAGFLLMSGTAVYEMLYMPLYEVGVCSIEAVLMGYSPWWLVSCKKLEILYQCRAVSQQRYIVTVEN